LSYEFHRSHRRRHRAGCHRLNLFVPLALLVEPAPLSSPHRSFIAAPFLAMITKN
jgi:hypothetical protein